LDKNDLLNEFIYLGGNHETEEVEDLYDKLCEYTLKVGDDPQIEGVICILRLWRNEFTFAGADKNIYYIGSYSSATPTVKRLIDEPEWDLHDINIAAHIVDYVSAFNQALELADKVLLKLEDYADSEFTRSIKLVLHTNMTLRLLRAKFTEVSTACERVRLKEMFMFHHEAAFKICSSDKERFTIPTLGLALRLSIFKTGNRLSCCGTTETLELLKTLKNEISEYEFLVRRDAELYSRKRESYKIRVE